MEYKYGVKYKLFILNICVVYKLLEILIGFVLFRALLFNSTNSGVFLMEYSFKYAQVIVVNVVVILNPKQGGLAFIM